VFSPRGRDTLRHLDLPAVAFAFVLALLLASTSAQGQQGRLASDFEIARMERQLERSSSFEAQVSGYLNLGDLRSSRSERALAHANFIKALKAAENERAAARRDSSLTRYAIATSYAALAEAKLGRMGEAFLLLEESVRYMSGDAATWNLHASAMRVLGRPDKAVSAARNAVAIARLETATVAQRLDLAVYQYALATALIENRQSSEAETLLVQVTDSLRSADFARLNREVVRQEAFEIYSSARGDVDAYVSLLNRAQLRLAGLYESRGEIAAAREQYQRVLEARTDDVTALGGLARLSATESDRSRHYADAFEANPFSPTLVRDYRRWLEQSRIDPRSIEPASTGARMRRALAQLAAGDRVAARESLAALAVSFPRNETLQALRREAESPAAATLPSDEPTTAELRHLLDAFAQMTPGQRVELDARTFTSEALFDPAGEIETSESRTLLASGEIDGLRFQFVQPTLFAGHFDTSMPLKLTYQILGVTRSGERPALLLEPLRVEKVR
jgi:tetratricopeptide (TPR) repeat protein